MKKSQPIRMCISCRSRYPQKSLIRLRLLGTEVVQYNGTGRSFYLCRMCIENQKKVKGLVKRFKQDSERFTKLLTELTSAVGSCDQSHLN